MKPVPDKMVTRDIALLCEGDFPSSIPLPDAPSIRLSKKCADSWVGREFTRALVDASVVAWEEWSRAR